MNRRVVITGASGFLGSNLIERIKNSDEYKIYALSSHPIELRSRVQGKRVEYYFKDAVLGAQASDILKGSIVVNCAYPRNSTGTVIADGLKYTQAVFESAVKYGAAGIINISSQSVYSQHRIDVASEETSICIESPYAVGKYAVELMLESICRGTKTRFTNLRMASLIGPGFDQRIVNRFVMKIIKQEPVTIIRQDKKLGFLDVEDAVNAILAVCNMKNCSWQSVYNVGNGIGYTVEEIYSEVASIMKDKVEIKDAMIETGFETCTTAVSYDRLQKDTGFSPKIDLEESIKRIVAKM